MYEFLPLSNTNEKALCARYKHFFDVFLYCQAEELIKPDHTQAFKICSQRFLIKSRPKPALFSLLDPGISFLTSLLTSRF